MACTVLVVSDDDMVVDNADDDDDNDAIKPSDGNNLVTLHRM